MKRRIIRAFCMKTGSALQAVAVFLFFIAGSADIEYSSLLAIMILLAASILIGALGFYLEGLLPMLYRRYFRKKKRARRKSKVCRMENTMRRAA